MPYDGVECQEIAKDELDFLDKRIVSFKDERDKCLCFKCYHICKLRNKNPKERQIVSCSALVYDFQGEYKRTIKDRVGLIING